MALHVFVLRENFLSTHAEVVRVPHTLCCAQARNIPASELLRSPWREPMGDKGAKLTNDAEAAAERLVEGLAKIGDVSSRKMFGGFGVFESGTMFGIVDSAGSVFLRAGETNTQIFEEAGSHRHSRMPYFSVPDSVLRDSITLRHWAESALSASRQAKNK